MPTGYRGPSITTLVPVLADATNNGYAVGSFAARCTPMIRPIVRAAQRLRSPAIVQISQKELSRYGTTPADVAAEFYAAARDERITVPLVLHLDHTRDTALIEEAIAAGFTSVMIDASERQFEENVAVSSQVAAYAHDRGVSVEAELGRIGTTDFVETEHDSELFTDPDEAERFVRETGIDALAVSVGTAHGVYKVRKPAIDYRRLEAIRGRTAVPLVLHGGSGVPAEMMHRAIRIPGGGVSKVNLATDLELALLGALGREERISDAECRTLPSSELDRAMHTVEREVMAKMSHFVMSAGHAGEPND